ncbi:MAG: LPXTG cell wall anchor domain-containing protein [Chloroflexi bacterium]|nr:LPXTG cell wall anchor domain-containing protein [Chloroflexota bacterium]
MMVRSLATVAIAAAALLLGAGFPGAALAGGWLVITLDSSPTGVRPGEPFTVGFMVRQHGVQPIDNVDPIVTAMNPASGERIGARGKGDGGGQGHYAVTLTLPSAGQWDWSIEAWGRPAAMTPILAGFPAMQAPAVPDAPAPAITEAVIRASAPPEQRGLDTASLAAWLPLAGVPALLAGTLALAWRRRRSAGSVPA